MIGPALPIVICVLGHALAAWIALLALGGLVAADASRNLTQCGAPHEDATRDWLYRSSLVNLVATLILVAAFNATHWPLRGAARLADRAPFLALGVFYTYRALHSLAVGAPLLAACLHAASPTRSFGVAVLLMQCVMYVLVPPAAVAYAVALYCL